MQEHAKSNWHGEACLLASEHERSQKEGTVAELIQEGNEMKTVWF